MTWKEIKQGLLEALQEGIKDSAEADRRLLEDAQKMADERRAALQHTACQQNGTT